MVKIVKNALKATLIACLRLYQIFISPLLGPRCRFYPSCSQYAMTALKQHGIMRGCLFSIKRLLKCHPWHPGGYDPVPKNKRGNR